MIYEPSQHIPWKINFNFPFFYLFFQWVITGNGGSASSLSGYNSSAWTVDENSWPPIGGRWTSFQKWGDAH